MVSRIIRANSEELKSVLSFSFDLAEIHETTLRPLEETVPPSDVSSMLSEPVNPEQEQRFLTAAQQQVEALLQKAQLQASEVEKQAYERGFSEGEKAGREVGEKMVEALLKQYAQTLEELKSLRQQVFETAKHEVVRLALEIAKKVVKREVSVDEEVILALVKVALNRLGEKSAMTVRVNPKDYQSLLRHRAGLAAADALHEGIRLVEDPMISRGGCLIETESGIIDARVEEQFREIERGFFE